MDAPNSLNIATSIAFFCNSAMGGPGWVLEGSGGLYMWYHGQS